MNVIAMKVMKVRDIYLYIRGTMVLYEPRERRWKDVC